MAVLETLFVTHLYRDEIEDTALLADLEVVAQALALDDSAGRRWCERNGYPGYTSYASLDDLPWRFPPVARLVRRLDRHARAFAAALDHDLRGRSLALDSLWVNVLPPGGMHGSHLHPQSVISGTFYVAVPPGASALKLEDPRLGLMMAAPPRKARVKPENRTFVSVTPKAGTLLLWESFLRHEVPLNQSDGERISISFNYAWR